MENLAIAILIQAVKDWEDETNRPEIREFLASEWFEDLAQLAGIDPRCIRRQLESGAYKRVPLRAAYRLSWKSKSQKTQDPGPVIHHRRSSRSARRQFGNHKCRDLDGYTG